MNLIDKVTTARPDVAAFSLKIQEQVEEWDRRAPEGFSVQSSLLGGVLGAFVESGISRSEFLDRVGEFWDLLAPAIREKMNQAKE